MGNIVVIDVETPNRYNDRICSIGLTLIEDGQITDTLYYLVNPESEFDQLNISIHGIRPIDVLESPIFPKIWNEISILVCSRTVVAHNANFDLCVLRKTLQSYGIFESTIEYACTLEISRCEISSLDNYKLPTLCNYAGIELDHHNAASDSNGCAKLLCTLLDSGLELDPYLKSFDLKAEIQQKAHHTRYLSSHHQSLNSLNDIVAAITCDNILNEDEIYFLQKWLNDNCELAGHYPYDQISGIIAQALLDGILEETELQQMLELFRKINDPVSSVCCECEVLKVENKIIVLTGEFFRGERSHLETELNLMGAICKKTVTKNTDYVIVGGQGSSAWCSGNYGTKVKKALELQEKGISIQIIRESGFYAALKGGQ